MKNIEYLKKKLAEEQGVTLFLSSTPLFRREMNYVTQAVRSADSPISYSYTTLLL